MAHNLNFRNGKASMMYSGETPWHNLGTKLQGLATSKEALQAAQLDWQVKKCPIQAITNSDSEFRITKPSENQFATVRMDTETILGVVGSRYEPIQNEDAFAFADSLVGSCSAIYETAGALWNGERVWMLAKLPDNIVLEKNGKKDVVDKYLLCCHSHDGTSQLVVKLTPIRVVCYNTLTLAMSQQGDEVRIRHTKNAKERIEQAHKILGLSNKVFTEAEEIFNRMVNTKTTDAMNKALISHLFPYPGKQIVSARIDNVRDTVLELVEVGKGSELPTSRGTLFGTYNAVTEYVDHVKQYRGVPDNKLDNVWFGDGAYLKKEAFETCSKIASGIDLKAIIGANN